jgi:Pyruvate/2-oxoacid:ferredoxin oxidoreductase gamma subunit
MERTKLIFCSSEKSKNNHELVAHSNSNNEIFLNIYDPRDESGYYNMFIALDKHTAIKLVKHLKREISFIMESEVNNE